MKVIRLLTESPDLEIPELALHADSSILTPGHPLFLPEEEAKWIAVPHLAVHICRLGKNIAAKFASRYHDRLSLALHITTSDTSLVDKRLNALRDLGDFAVVLGQWVDRLPEPLEINELTLDPSRALKFVDPVIASISRRTTFKTGDIILIPAGPAIPLERWMNSPGLMNVKVI